MNLLIMFIFFIIMFFQYYLLGTLLLDFSSYSKSLPKTLILGYFATYFITFLVGVPFQIIKASWNLYFIIQLIVFIIIDILIIFLKKENFLDFFNDLKNIDWKHDIINWIVNNWVCILFVILFASFSRANQLPIYNANYDDFYYIGKMVNLVDSPNLLNENYYNGALDLASSDIVRLFNTYELSYAFFATLFHFKLTFFCRTVMVIHNYFMFALVYKEISKLFLRESFAQYALIPFFIFLIPCGYLQSVTPIANLRIFSYDLWQFQTAAFYGGSVVRMLSFPTLLLFSMPLIERIDFRKILIMGLLSISLFSFSSIFLQNFLVFLIFILLIKMINMCLIEFNNKNYRRLYIYIFSIIIFVLLLVSSKYLDHFSFVNTESFRDCINGYNAFVYSWFNFDIILKYGIFPLLIGFIISKTRTQKLIYLFVFVLYFFFNCSWFDELYAITATNFFFVTNRTVASIQYLLVLFFGICVSQILCYFFKKLIVFVIIGFVSIGSTVCYFSTHIETFKQYDFLGSGICKVGWDFSRIFELNHDMQLEIFSQIGDYFNKLPYDNYMLYSPDVFQYGDYSAVSVGFTSASNRIQIHERDGFKGMNGDEISFINNFCNGENQNVAEVLLISQKVGIDYIVVFDSYNSQLLVQNGAKLVLTSNNDVDYYLLELAE